MRRNGESERSHTGVESVHTASLSFWLQSLAFVVTLVLCDDSETFPPSLVCQYPTVPHLMPSIHLLAAKQHHG
ncbi:hypothetical protein FA13DRAFT_1739496, partial [Coprinellus micaceus]